MGVRRGVMVAAIGVIVAMIMPIVLWGFTVDDALISCRYAFHVATGQGYRFNAGGATTDGVTPLPWPWILAPFSRGGPLASLLAAKTLGLCAWLATVAWAAIHVDRLRRRPLDWMHLSLVVGAPTPAIAAWAVAGMETGLVMALATTATLLTGSGKRRWLGTLAAGLAAAFRPELLPWAFVLSVGHAWCALRDAKANERDSALVARTVVLHTTSAVALFAAVALIRSIWFGSLAPLAVRAKPSDLEHGLAYALAGVLLTGPFIAVLAPLAWRRLPLWPRWILVAAGVHVCAVIAAGGDWMPMSRLLAPVLPSLAVVFAHLAAVARPWSTLARLALCVAGQAFVFWRVGGDAATVMAQRMRLIEQLAPRVDARDRIATVDVGWVGASFGGTVIDLAGVTDPSIASLPGGHTTKQIPSLFLAERDATILVLQLPQGCELGRAWEEGQFQRGVESHVSRLPWVRANFTPGFVIHATERVCYGVLVRASSGTRGHLL